jgi:hypothetical protein
MADVLKVGQKIAVVEEDTQGTYKAPSSGTEFVSPLSDGATIEMTREFMQRNNLTSSLGKPTSRMGMASVTATLPCEFKAAGTTGAAPEYDLLLQSAGFNKSTVTETTTGSGHTTTKLVLSSDTDALKYSVGDIVCVQDDSYGTFISPVSAVDSVDGGDGYSITLKLAGPHAFSNGAKISAMTLYKPNTTSGFPTLSISRWLEDAVCEKAFGCRTNSVAMSNYSVGQMPQLEFSMEGLGFDKDLEVLALTPSYSSALPPIALQACVWKDAAKIEATEISWSVENTQGFKSTTCSPNGKIASRLTERTVTGSLTTYKYDDNIDNYIDFNAGDTFSLFSWAGNETSTTGEFEQCVAFYMPSCMINAISEGDQDLLLTEQLSFNAERGSSGNIDELIIAIF